MTRRNRALIAAAVGVVLCLVWVGWRVSRRPPAPPPSGATTVQRYLAPAGEDKSPTMIYAHNLILRKGPHFRVYVRWIRGQMLRTRPEVNPSFDDPESFVLQIEKGVIRANLGDIANYLNSSAPAKAPLKNISIEPAGEQLKIHGTLHKGVPLPIELTGKMAPLPNGRMEFEVAKLNVLKIPLKGLLGSFHVELSDLMEKSNVDGVQISGNNIIFDTQRLLPPPHIHGQLTSVRVSPPDIEVIYGNAPNDEARLAKWHNFLRLNGGTVDFGKLTMHNTDLTMIDASQDPWFDLDLVNYQAQVVNGIARITPQAGLEIFMPDLDERAPNRGMKSIPLDWLKDRNRTLPPDIPVK